MYCVWCGLKSPSGQKIELDIGIEAELGESYGFLSHFFVAEAGKYVAETLRRGCAKSASVLYRIFYLKANELNSSCIAKRCSCLRTPSLLSTTVSKLKL